MNRFLRWMTAALLLMSFSLPAAAAEDPLVMEDVTVQPGQTVYVTVNLTQSVTGDTVGLTYDYDRERLQVIPGQCSWSKTAALEDFSPAGEEAVWAAGDSVDLEGEICVLVFRLLTEETFEDSPVTCRLLVKNGPDEVAEYAASACVSVVCAHSYGDWENDGPLFHNRLCELCGAEQTQSHSWGDPTVQEDPQDPTLELKTWNCTLCGGEKSESFRHQMEVVPPTVPVVLTPTEPEETVPPVPTMPQEITEPTEPTKPSAPERQEQSEEQTHTHRTEDDGRTQRPEQTEPTSESAQRTEPTEPDRNRTDRQTESQQTVTEPSVYQPKDYNAAAEPTEAEKTDGTMIRTEEPTKPVTADRTATDAATETRSPADETAASRPDQSAADPQQVHTQQTRPRQEQAQEHGAQKQGYAGIWSIAALSVCLMALPELLKKKRDSH